MTRLPPVFRPLIAIAALGALGACDGFSLPFSDGGVTLDTQLTHPAAVVVQVRSIRSSGDRTLVDLHVLNGRDGEISFNASNERTYLLTDSGEKLLLVPATGNPELKVPPNKAMDAALVFAGKLPGSGKAVLFLNESGSRDNAYTTTPRFEATLPIDGARGGGSIPEASAMSNMASLPTSKIGPARQPGTAFGASGTPASTLQAVDKLKSDLGAVDTDRGTVVSLPGDVTFEFDKAALRTDAHVTLDRVAELIKAAGDGEIRIEGHTDAKGDDAYNKRLSEQRTESVKAYLVGKGIAADRLKTIGLGELRPVAPNANPDGTDDEEGRQRNRRVEIILPRIAGQPAPG